MTNDFGTMTASELGTGQAGETDASSAPGLWAGDTGVIGEQARRALLELIKGPYLSGVKAPALWSALLADEAGIRSRLHELFLELVIDRVGEFAFVRNVSTDELKVPSAVRTAALTFLDTAMLLVLRQMLLAGEGDGRVIVGQEDVFEQLRLYRTPDRDESDFNKRLNSTWLKMKNTLRVIHQAGAEDRAEISPVLRLIVDADHIAAIGNEYRRIAETGGSVVLPNVGGVHDADLDGADNADADQIEGMTS
ncbi:DUF4194 domain-containing protein [Cryobacterium inferilacus]|uniref:DUF4194 domain-containing protein n=1 Tax=Cryobacterium inferilacus TaxID=2866629 RepID=UPI0027E33F7D|nr:DUF4194 domain-containing protein [Cryobacterium sp. 1639]